MSTSHQTTLGCLGDEGDGKCWVVMQNTFINVVATPPSSLNLLSSKRRYKSDSCLYGQAASMRQEHMKSLEEGSAEEGLESTAGGSDTDETSDGAFITHSRLRRRASDISLASTRSSSPEASSEKMAHQQLAVIAVQADDSSAAVQQEEAPAPLASSSAYLDDDDDDLVAVHWQLTQQNQALREALRQEQEQQQQIQQQFAPAGWPMMYDGSTSSEACGGYPCMDVGAADQSYGFQPMWWPMQFAYYPQTTMEPLDHEQLQAQQQLQPQQKQKQKQKKTTQKKEVQRSPLDLDGDDDDAWSQRQCSGEHLAEQEAAGEMMDGEDDNRTTVMLRNLPNNYTRAMLLKLLETEGFIEKVTFLYLPIDFKTQAALGYAFVDLVNTDAVKEFRAVFEGFSRWALPSKKASFISWCGIYQGVKEHIERYRNSPMMHNSVPDEYKPVILEKGERVPFPKPTKSIRAPRVRNCRRSGGQHGLGSGAGSAEVEYTTAADGSY